MCTEPVLYTTLDQSLVWALRKNSTKYTEDERNRSGPACGTGSAANAFISSTPHAEPHRRDPLLENSKNTSLYYCFTARRN